MPGLLDMVATAQKEEAEKEGFGRASFAPHWPMERVREALKKGEVWQGVLRMSRSNCLEGSLMLEGFEKPVVVQGKTNLNRWEGFGLVSFDCLPQLE